MSSRRGILKHCPFKKGEASKAYKAAVIISILYPGGECDTACQRERPDQPRTFCRKPALQQSWHEVPAKCGQSHTVTNYVSVSQAKQASTHSLKSSRLDVKCVLTSCGQMGTISLYESKPFVTVWDWFCVMATTSVWSWNKKLHYLNWNWFRIKKAWLHFWQSEWPHQDVTSNTWSICVCVKKWINVNKIIHPGHCFTSSITLYSSDYSEIFRLFLRIAYLQKAL